VKRSACAAAAASGHGGEIVGEPAPGVGRAVPGEAGFPANRGARLGPALRREEERRSGTDEGAHEQPRAEKPDVLPVD
jgi:hypothetical protein